MAGQSPLLMLPTELRCDILDFLFAGHRYPLQLKRTEQLLPHPPTDGNVLRSVLPPLYTLHPARWTSENPFLHYKVLSVSRQIRAEARRRLEHMFGHSYAKYEITRDDANLLRLLNQASLNLPEPNQFWDLRSSIVANGVRRALPSIRRINSLYIWSPGGFDELVINKEQYQALRNIFVEAIPRSSVGNTRSSSMWHEGLPSSAPFTYVASPETLNDLREGKHDLALVTEAMRFGCFFSARIELPVNTSRVSPPITPAPGFRILVAWTANLDVHSNDYKLARYCASLKLIIDHNTHEIVQRHWLKGLCELCRGDDKVTPVLP